MNSEQSFFIEGTLNICRHLNIEDALFACLDVVRQVMPADGLYMQYLDPEFGALRVAAKATAEGGAAVDALVPLAADARKMVAAFAGHFAEAGTPDALIYNRPETDPICRAMLGFHGALDRDSSLLILLLGTRGTMFGSITLHAYGHDRFTEEHARIFSLLKDPFTIAVSNARRHREVIRLRDLLADDNRYLQDEIRRISGDTIIGKNTKIDNEVHIAHGVVIGEKCLMAACSAIAGKSTIGNEVTILGQVGIIKDVRVGDKAVILSKSLVTKDIAGGKVYFGTPAQETRTIYKELAYLRKLPHWAGKVDDLIKNISKKLDIKE